MLLIKNGYHFTISWYWMTNIIRWSTDTRLRSKLYTILIWIFYVKNDSLLKTYIRTYIRILGLEISISDYDSNRVIIKQHKMKKYQRLEKEWNEGNFDLLTRGLTYWDC
jgi:hypothetical protein